MTFCSGLSADRTVVEGLSKNVTLRCGLLTDAVIYFNISGYIYHWSMAPSFIRVNFNSTPLSIDIPNVDRRMNKLTFQCFSGLYFGPITNLIVRYSGKGTPASQVDVSNLKLDLQCLNSRSTTLQ